MTVHYNAGLPLDGDNEAVRVYPATGAEHVDTTNRVARGEIQDTYQVVPVTTQTALGAGGGAVGDRLGKIHALTGTTVVVVKDGNTTVYTWTLEAGEQWMPFDWISIEGAWSLTCTGAGVVASGRFT